MDVAAGFPSVQEEADWKGNGNTFALLTDRLHCHSYRLTEQVKFENIFLQVFGLGNICLYC